MRRHTITVLTGCEDTFEYMHGQNPQAPYLGWNLGLPGPGNSALGFTQLHLAVS